MPTLSFSSFNTESGYDFVKVYDGTTTSATLLGSFSGSSLPSSVSSTGGNMLVQFTSDIFITAPGWSANISCVIPPVTNFSATPTNVNTGGSVSFTDLSTNTPTSWSWSFSGGTPNTSTSQNPTVTYNTAGTYNVTLTATNADGSNTLTKTSYINVTNPSPPVANFTANTTNINMGGTVSFTDLSTNSPTSWSWIFPGGTPGTSNSQNPTMTYNTAGTYNVTLTATNAGGSNTLTKTSYITVVDPCAVSTEVYLTDIAFYDQPTIQSTPFGSYFTALPNSLSYNPNNPNNFLERGRYVRFKIKCKNLKTNGQSIVSGLCKIRTNDLYLTLIDSTSGLNNVPWNGTAWSTDEFEIYISPSVNNGYVALIDFVVIEGTNEYSTKCVSIPIRPLVFSPANTGTIDDDSNPDSNGNNDNLCNPGETIEFFPWLDNISTLSADYVRGSLENLDGLSGINIWNNVAGVSGTVYNSGWWNYSFSVPQTINAGDQNMSPEYDFVFDYTYTSTYMFDLYLVTGGGFYLFGGSNDRTLIQWTLPYTFNPGFPLGIKESVELNNAINIYPNPTTGEFIIEIKNPRGFENLGGLEIKLLNITGQVIYEEKLTKIKKTHQTKIDINGYAKGIYTLKIISNKGVIHKKIVVE